MFVPLARGWRPRHGVRWRAAPHSRAGQRACTTGRYAPSVKIGLIGSGNMARAMARGWGEPVLCTDSGSGSAQALVDELGGERVATNLELAERVDLVVLCHKPYHLGAVAREIAGSVKAVASVLGGVTTDKLRNEYPGAEVFALIPNTPVEIRQGVVVYAER